jgi:hypothetical protein
MKKYILVAALVLASTNAMADRVVSGTNGNGNSRGNTESEACEGAKDDALDKRSYNEQVAKYYSCDCHQNKKDRWICTVDARLQKVR